MTETSDHPDAGHDSGQGVVKKKDFVERSALRSGVKKAEARAAIDAALAVLAEALDRGEDLVLPPLGRLKVARAKVGPKGKQLILKLSLPKNEENALQGVAEGGDTD